MIQDIILSFQRCLSCVHGILTSYSNIRSIYSPIKFTVKKSTSIYFLRPDVCDNYLKVIEYIPVLRQKMIFKVLHFFIVFITLLQRYSIGLPTPVHENHFNFLRIYFVVFSNLFIMFLICQKFKMLF